MQMFAGRTRSLEGGMWPVGHRLPTSDLWKHKHNIVSEAGDQQKYSFCDRV